MRNQPRVPAIRCGPCRIALQRSRVHDSKDLDPQSLALRETREHVTIASIVAAAANDSQFPCHGPCGTQPP
jgi:hypothetical protein